MTKQYIIFENQGEIDLRAIKTFGVNSKETSNPFGYFGTGLKIAIGMLLRKGQAVTIQIGTETYNFGLRSARIRVDDFDIVTMNGEELGFTSQVGKDWELWQAYRELYCNAKDEGAGETQLSDSIPEPTAGMTRVIVEGKAFAKVHAERGDFILSSTPFISTENLDIHHGQSKYVFLQGIRIGSMAYGGVSSTFTYNLKCKVDLTEDRTLKYQFQARRPIVVAILHSTDAEFIKQLLTTPEGVAEFDLDFCDGPTPGDTFLQVAKALYMDKSQQVNASAIKVLKIHCSEDFSPRPAELNFIEKAQLEKAKKFCKALDFDVESKPIVVAETLGSGILGLADNGTIYVSREAFDTGTKMVANVLIEEYIHLKHGYADCTRGMQNFLFNRMMSFGELVIGEPL